MPYKHPADKINTILYWRNQEDSFGGNFNPKHSHWLMLFSKVIDIALGDIEAIKLQFKNCMFRVERHSQRFDREAGLWVECEPFLRVDIDAEAYIPSTIEGQKIVPCKENAKLLERIFWQVWKKQKVEALSEKEFRQNKLAFLN